MALLEQQDDFAGRHPDQITIKPTRQQAIIKIPGGFFPHSDFENAVWIVMKPTKIRRISTAGRAGTYIPGKVGTTFKFLAPESFVDVHNHNWTEYESFQSRLLERIRAAHVGVEQFGQISDQVAKELTSGKVSDINTLRKLEASVIRATNTDIPQYKVDTPLVYRSSGRREMTLDFKLASSDGGSDIMQAIKLLQQYCAPQTVKDNFISIEFPYIWRIESDPPGLLLFERAAITSIQPEYKSPYVNGNATVIDLNISFKDIDPLFSSNIEDTDSIVHVEETRTEPASLQQRRAPMSDAVKRKLEENGQ